MFHVPGVKNSERQTQCLLTLGAIDFGRGESK